MSDEHPLQPRHPIRVVAQRTALSTEVLRAWERRYNVVVPGRTPTGQRLYSDADIERLRLLRQATQFGRSISQVAELGTEELAELIREDEVARAERVNGHVRPDADRAAAAPHLHAAEAAVCNLDASRLEAVLMRAMVVLSADSFLDDTVVPLLRFLGSRWVDGTISVAHEHMASAVLRRVLGSMTDASDEDADAPVLVTATPARQVHEFGALLAAAAGGALGWRVLYLGADLPARDIVLAARQAGARAVALSLVFSADDPQTADELRAVRQGVGSEVELLVGGAAAANYALLLDEIGARLLPDLSALRSALREVAGAPQPARSTQGGSGAAPPSAG
jgi:MerR family transcriptional regulator, light-induced transcriptional regulator